MGVNSDELASKEDVKEEIKETETEIKDDLKELETEIKDDLKELKEEIKEETDDQIEKAKEVEPEWSQKLTAEMSSMSTRLAELLTLQAETLKAIQAAAEQVEQETNELTEQNPASENEGDQKAVETEALSEPPQESEGALREVENVSRKFRLI